MFRTAIFSILLFTLFSFSPIFASYIPDSVVKDTISELQHGRGTKALDRAEIGVRRVASFWQEQDGTSEQFKQFCLEQFEPDNTPLLNRFEKDIEALLGHYNEISRIISEPAQLDITPILPFDDLFGNFSVSAHLTDDLFKTKVAFSILLNFPKYTLAEKNQNGLTRSREDWAKMRAGDYFDVRIPAITIQMIASKYNAADAYISSYNIYMHNLVTSDGRHLFPENMKLISHWGLRDELKSQYANCDGLERQNMIQKVMERIIAQEIPSVMINNSEYDWDPYTNAVYKDGKVLPNVTREPDRRYAVLKSIFDAVRERDKFHPEQPNFIDRYFDTDLEISEKEVRQLLISVLSSKEVIQAGKLASKRLGRHLLPFDIWYNGFENKPKIDEAKLDKKVATKYPNLESFQKDIPNILIKLGFQRDEALFIASKISVDPARGAGHAMGPESRLFNAHLRTRLENGKMNYKSYNIACHELGHCVEQVYSNVLIDHKMLAGVPNIAFTEAFAFIFQAKDLELLGIQNKEHITTQDLALETLWKTYEIGGVSLTTMDTWRWLYAHPDCTPTQLREAVLEIAKNIWNRYYFPVFGKKDCTLLAVYSHMIDSDLYLPNYPIGHIIAYQIDSAIQGKNLANKMRRFCLQGSLTPDVWMRGAVGEPISTEMILKNSAEKLQIK